MTPTTATSVSTRALLILLLVSTTCSDAYHVNQRPRSPHTRRDVRTIDTPSSGCLHEGRWYRSGATVTAREPCLRCACAGGALSCARRTCAQLPDPPPPRCHVLHRRNTCCPELHCAGGVYPMEQTASARAERDEFTQVVRSGFPHGLSCVEGSSSYSPGSAMPSAVACEQCFCLGGRRRCVRPTCLPPPPGCRPKPAPGACCPQRYHCDHAVATTPSHPGRDCKFANGIIPEGERVPAAEANCTHCFCLRGAVKCQELSCAPPLLGCKPLLRPGQCCPHQYQCQHHVQQELNEVNREVLINNLMLAHNALAPPNPNEDRSFHTKYDVNDKLSSDKNSKTVKEILDNITTGKVKRKTAETYYTSPHYTHSSNYKISKLKEYTTERYSTIDTDSSTTEEIVGDEERTSTDQPEETIKIMVNGTINCTTEVSSSSHPVNISDEEAERILSQSLPRSPSIDRMDVEDHTFDLDDIITDQRINGQFDENDTFTINVTSSLRTNTSYQRPGIVGSVPKAKPGVVADLKLNTSKKTKEEYDYDYTEPTLPPSLPNLKIIPFVAADAVLDEKKKAETVPTYPVLEREDKFPVYYPKNDKEAPFATRREDVYSPSQYPIFTSDKHVAKTAGVPTREVSGVSLPGINDLTASLHEYAVSASLGNEVKSNVSNKKPIDDEEYEVESPDVNLFSPPVETEGGFIPKGPGLIDEYYAVYPSTPAGPHIPHLTTSMQLDTDDGACTASDGRRVPEGESISVGCLVCACAWGSLHCAPRPCSAPPPPPGCRRRPATPGTSDSCCGEIVCAKDNNTSVKYTTTSRKPTTSTTTTTEEPLEEEEEIDEEEEDEDPETDKIDEDRDTETPLSVTKTTTTSTTTEATTSTMSTTTEKYINNITIFGQETASKPKATPPPPPTRNNTDTLLNNIKFANSFATTKSPITTTTETPTVTPPEVEEEEQEDTEEHGQEYEEEEEDDDEGFSFGSVLKLLLSESYDSTTAPPFKRMPPTVSTKMEIPNLAAVTNSFLPPSSTFKPLSTIPSTSPKPVTSPRPVSSLEPTAFTTSTAYLSAISFTPTTPRQSTPYKLSTPSSFKPTYKTSTTSTYRPTTIRQQSTARPSSAFVPSSTRRPPPKATVAPFVPLQQHHQLYAPPKNYYPATSVNRIDHLVLGEATAIRKPTVKPLVPVKPAIFNRPTTTTTTRKPAETRPVDVPNNIGLGLGSLGSGAGGLKLAGCNIYGQMYRVGRIIAELSTPCRECRCTDIGVQCRDLSC